MRQREEIIKAWLDMWLEAVFTPDVHYYEFQGREYEGIDQIRRWFETWNSENRVVKWEVGRFVHDQDLTLVPFYFQNVNKEGEKREYEGVYLASRNCRNSTANCLITNLTHKHFCLLFQKQPPLKKTLIFLFLDFLRGIATAVFIRKHNK